MQRFRALLPPCFEHAAAFEKILGLCLDEHESFGSAAKQNIGIRGLGQQHKEGVQQRKIPLCTACQRVTQGRQRDLEHRWETQQRFAARTGDTMACRHQLSVGRCRGACNRDGAQIAAPVVRDDSAQVFIGWRDIARSRTASRRRQYAVREDRAAVRVDAVRGKQHA